MKMWKLVGVTSLAALGTAAPVQADTIFGLYAGAQLWAMEGDGSFGNADENTSGNVDFDSETQNVLHVAIEHPIPFIPNLKFKRTDLEDSGDGNVNFTFGGQSFSGDINTNADFSHTDIILYYELLDNVVSLDVGVNVMQMDGSVVVSDGTNTVREEFDGYIPTLYLAAEAALPFTGLSIGGEISGLAAGGSSFYDYQVQIQYNVIDNMAIDLGVQLGYRATGLKLDDVDNLDTDLTFSGPYAGVQVHF
ncbi:MAG TPA: TIGR04219 family outer membrane beta-barrel protein [Motiliproteus sp.]